MTNPTPVALIKDFLSASHEIIPGKLYQSSALGELRQSLHHDGPLYVISCIDSPEPPGLTGFLRFPFEDGPKLPDSKILMSIGLLGATWLLSGKVVVHCLAGNNRSGLLIGTILYAFPSKDWPDGPAIVRKIQSANPDALYNDTFRHYLESMP
jgi:hypothetical protein